MTLLRTYEERLGAVESAEQALEAAQGALSDFYETRPHIGADVSEHQGEIDWSAAASKIDFVFCKATEGLDYVDPRFTEARVRRVRSAGILLGVYHFARPQPGRDPRAEAAHFVTTAIGRGALRAGDLPGVLDIEWSKGLDAEALGYWVGRFVNEYYQRTAHLPVIYTGSFWRDQMKNPDKDYGCSLWLAAYVSDPTPYVPVAWKDGGFDFWQYTDKGSVPGISGGVDLDRFRGTAAELLDLRIGGR